MKKKFKFIIFVILIIPALTFTDSLTDRYFPGDEWRISTPEAQGMDSGYLVKMLDYVKSNNLEIHSLIIIRHGYVVMEAYGEPFRKDIIHTLNSGTKSFTSALVSIAIREGCIKNVDQKIADIFSDRDIKNLDDKKKSISVRHLLTMSSGIEWGMWDSNTGDYWRSDNWTQYFLDLPVKTHPGKVYNYNTGGANLLLAAVQKTAGIKLQEFIEKFLFNPLGITKYYWLTDPQGIRWAAEDSL